MARAGVKHIEIDASCWRGPLDFYDAILAALDAPGWHGHSVDALIDSIIVGNINGVDPPYRIEVSILLDAEPVARVITHVPFDVSGGDSPEDGLEGIGA